MRTLKTCLGFVFGLSFLAIFVVAQANGYKKHKGGTVVAPSPQYEAACGSCHMAYPPMLLPVASWRKIVPDSGEHFGDSLALPPAELREIQAYLEANAADRSSSKKARKIVESLGGAAPERVSEVPYIVRKHRKVAPDVFKRAAVGGLGNCASCHPGATSGNFEDDAVRIPE